MFSQQVTNVIYNLQAGSVCSDDKEIKQGLSLAPKDKGTIMVEWLPGKNLKKL